MALVDGDPYGIDILSVYTNGSVSLRHENEKLAAGRVEWLGIWASELAESVYRCCAHCSSFSFVPERLNIDRDALIPITEHDEKKASKYSFFR